MSILSKHAEWLSLIEVFGPFLAVGVLDRLFPQGLEAVYPEAKRRIRSAYEEWCDAVDDDDRDLNELHQAWLKLVLSEFLEYPDDVLLPGDEYHVSGDDGNGIFHPDWILKGNDDKPMLFIKAMPPRSDLLTINRQDDWTASVWDKMTKLCRVNNVRLGLITDGERWMLVNAPNGSTSGHISWYARLWFQEPKTLQAFSSLLGVRRFFGRAEDTLSALLDESLSCLEEITDTLGSQVRTAVEVLIQGLDKADEDRNRELLRDVAPSELYEAGLTVMMRLVFVLCAEERGLLLPGNETYDQCYAVSTLRGQLAEEADKHGAEILERRHDAWARLLAVFRIVYGGIEHEELRLPALGGSIFDPDKFPFLEGRNTGSSWKECNPTPLPIDNRTVLLLLNSLQVLEQSGGAILLSYRALDVEQIGHIYEGLLEHTAVRAQDVTLGLSGSSKAKNPNVRLSQLESLAMDSESALFAKLKEITMRSPAAIKNGYTKAPTPELVDKLSAVCAGDQTLIERIKPFANYLRMDAWEQPLVYPKDAFMVTLGQDRRESGTHYTPKILTEKIVKTTLEPVVYRGPAEGKAREEWTLKTPAELLNLKICDPAMGSGAFLVQVCRYLAERLFEAWDQAEQNGKFVTADGRVCDTPNDEPMTKVVDERINEARRLIAEKCLYGVDINPLAVELAKLSIWLVTISKGRPFGYLDHNLKSGDSLLGIHDIDQLRELRMKPTGHGNSNLFGQGIGNAVDEAIKLRWEIRNTVIRDITDVEKMVECNAKAQHQLEKVNLLADLFIGEVFSFTGNTNKLQDRLDALSTVVEEVLSGDAETQKRYRREAQHKLDLDLPVGKKPRRPFHWSLEFPEVFHDGGFDAICGNPPFLGNSSWKACLGAPYSIIISNILSVTHSGKIDLSVVFHRRSYNLLKKNRTYGLLATANISEGQSVAVGLGIISNSGTIYNAQKDYKWLGGASVRTSFIIVFKGAYKGCKELNNELVNFISPKLYPEAPNCQLEVYKIKTSPFAFKGIDNSKGLAFILTPGSKLYNKLYNENNSLLRPYITGDDINSNALFHIARHALDIGDKKLEEIAEYYPLAYDFLLNQVHHSRTPEELSSYKGLADRWWQFWNHRVKQYNRLRKYDRCIVISRITKFPVGIVAPTSYLYLEGVIIIAFERPDMYAISLSCIFHEWCFKYQGAKFGVGGSLRLSVTDTLSTFPLPAQVGSSDIVEKGMQFDNLVKQWCHSQRGGVTDFMNDIHDQNNNDSAIIQGRKLLVLINEAVLALYGWTDIDNNYDFHEVPYLYETDNIRYTISEPARIEILRRLAILNKQRWQEEQEAEK